MFFIERGKGISLIALPGVNDFFYLKETCEISKHKNTRKDNRLYLMLLHKSLYSVSTTMDAQNTYIFGTTYSNYNSKTFKMN